MQHFKDLHRLLVEKNCRADTLRIVHIHFTARLVLRRCLREWGYEAESKVRHREMIAEANAFRRFHMLLNAYLAWSGSDTAEAACVRQEVRRRTVTKVVTSQRKNKKQQVLQERPCQTNRMINGGIKQETSSTLQKIAQKTSQNSLKRFTELGECKWSRKLQSSSHKSASIAENQPLMTMAINRTTALTRRKICPPM